ncbi:uncharacterized protein DS421_19g651150 [Arachis hypogaea]|uniref:Uncharacterized protein n=1 Tax=Arachis hypogaea TaxID=3818 RepID=A0A6B9VAK8_ARAHY|nr:uncharacterized protein DS421_19g651150 [Arachis hypogaea]
MERERKEKKGGSWNQRAREGEVEEGGRRRRASLPPCRRVAVRKEETLSERKSSARKESRCASIAALPPPSHLPSRTTLRMHRRDRRVEIGRRRKKEEALFALLHPVTVRGVTVVAAVRGCVTEPLSPENSAASLGFTIGASDRREGQA